MKNKIYILFLVVLSGVVACDDFSLENQGIELELLPGYVAYNAPGASINLDTIRTSEGAANFRPETARTDRELFVECPTGTLSDITVSFSITGSAVLGVDYNITGLELSNLTATGGQLKIVHDTQGGGLNNGADGNGVNGFDFAQFNVEPLTDGVTDGQKTLVITLDSAVGVDGTAFETGRGGTDFLKTLMFIISDVD